MDEPKRILFVNSEIFPYLPESEIAAIGRKLPQAIQESGKEIRTFMPRYGCVNERRNQLHEVIRLSGINIAVGEVDLSLVIKVASISAARMQVYFIDNEDYFQRKAVFADENGKFFEDNGERAVFFARGVLETVKKLRWKPDIVHCQGWISHFFPFFMKKVYNNDPVFSDSKIVLSLYNEYLDEKFNPNISGILSVDGIRKTDIAPLSEANGMNLAKLAIRYSDGIIEGVKNLDPELKAAVAERKLPVLSHVDSSKDDASFNRAVNGFYDTIISSNVKNK